MGIAEAYMQSRIRRQSSFGDFLKFQREMEDREQVRQERERRLLETRLEHLDEFANNFWIRRDMSPDEENALHGALNQTLTGLGLPELPRLPDVVGAKFAEFVQKAQQGMMGMKAADPVHVQAEARGWAERGRLEFGPRWDAIITRMYNEQAQGQEPSKAAKTGEAGPVQAGGADEQFMHSLIGYAPSDEAAKQRIRVFLDNEAQLKYDGPLSPLMLRSLSADAVTSGAITEDGRPQFEADLAADHEKALAAYKEQHTKHPPAAMWKFLLGQPRELVAPIIAQWGMDPKDFAALSENIPLANFYAAYGQKEQYTNPITELVHQKLKAGGGQVTLQQATQMAVREWEAGERDEDRDARLTLALQLFDRARAKDALAEDKQFAIEVLLRTVFPGVGDEVTAGLAALASGEERMAYLKQLGFIEGAKDTREDFNEKFLGRMLPRRLSSDAATRTKQLKAAKDAVNQLYDFLHPPQSKKPKPAPAASPTDPNTMPGPPLGQGPGKYMGPLKFKSPKMTAWYKEQVRLGKSEDTIRILLWASGLRD